MLLAGFRLLHFELNFLAIICSLTTPNLFLSSSPQPKMLSQWQNATEKQEATSTSEKNVSSEQQQKYILSNGNN